MEERIMKICSKCGFMNDNGDNYCERCGQDLNESEPIENNNSISLEEPNKKKKAFYIIGASLVALVCILGLVVLCVPKNTEKNSAPFYNTTKTVSYREFIKNWNNQVNSNNTFTNGVHIDENINYNFEIQLKNDAILQCSKDDDKYYITYKKSYISEKNFKNSLTELLKMVYPDISEEKLNSETEKYPDNLKGYTITVGDNSYDVDSLKRYVQKDDVVFDTETGYASMAVSFSSFKNSLKSEYAKYLAGDDSSAVTSEILSEANNIIDTVLNSYSVVHSDYWSSDVKEYYFDFARKGNWGMVRATIDVEQDNDNIVFMSVACTDYYLNDYYNDCCRMVTRSLGVSNSTIGNALTYSEDEDLFSCVYRGIRYTQMTKSNMYSRMEFYPYSRYEETKYTLINPKTSTNDTALK